VSAKDNSAGGVSVLSFIGFSLHPYVAHPTFRKNGLRHIPWRETQRDTSLGGAYSASRGRRIRTAKDIGDRAGVSINSAFPPGFDLDLLAPGSGKIIPKGNNV
jgi:hypothetical protein